MDKKQLTLGSLFDGSGGFPLGGILAGIKPMWASEVEPFPIRVTTKRLPSMKHYGDVAKLSGHTLPPVDIITFGSPCQDLSIAGKRAGIHKGTRSNLFFEAIRIIKEMREETNGTKPRFIVWENVPGAFSSNRGEDFRAVLEAVISVKEEGIPVPAPENHRWAKADVLLGDGFSVAYRVFDAQYWSVPQRRARIYLVADFNGGRAGEILFKSEGLSGYSPEGCRPWEGTAGSVEKSSGTPGGRTDAGTGNLCVNTQGRSGVSVTEDVTETLIAQDHGNHPAVLQEHPSVLHAAGFSTEHSAKARSIGYEEERSPTLRAGVVPAAMMFDNHPQDCRYDGPMEQSPTVTARYGTGGNNQPLIAEPDIKAFGVCSKKSNSMLSDNPKSGFYEAKTSRTLDRGGGNPTANQGGIAIVAFTQNQREEVRDLKGKSGALQAQPGMNQQTYILQGSMIGRKEKNGPQGDGINEDVCFTLNTADRHAVVTPSEKEPTYCATTGGFLDINEEKSHTLMARDYKDPQIVNDTMRNPDVADNEPQYIVRRLMPVECARLQGFPDWWCNDLETPDPTDEELAFWMNVWQEWNTMNGKKPKTEKQVRKWLANPYSDSAEYKLWGNGISLPIAYFVLAGIVWAAGLEDD